MQWETEEDKGQVPEGGQWPNACVIYTLSHKAVYCSPLFCFSKGEAGGRDGP